MKNIFTHTVIIIVLVSAFSSFAQNTHTGSIENGGEYVTEKYDADHPEITPRQYVMLDKQCAENIMLLGLDKLEKSKTSVLLEWPVRPAVGFTDCNYYIVTAYVDQNTSAGAMNDYNCGSNTYDTHQGTDICIWPFPFYKMDHFQVEVIAAAAGTIIAKADGNFDRNCASNSLTANYVIIQHSDNSCALYWHMKSGSVTTKSVGQTVAVGEYLGVVGSSGSSTGPHLHFEVWSSTSSATYKDPYSGTCNLLNATSWWVEQKSYIEPSILKASVHITDAVIPGCDTTETPNESTSYNIPFQGPGLSPGYAKFYIFIRDEVIGTTVNLSILNPGGSTFNSWVFNCNHNYNGSYWCWSKLLPTIPGTYTFQASYNGITCSQNFDIFNTTGINTISSSEQFHVYPNPAGEFINITGVGIENGNYKFILKNILGQELLKEDDKIGNNSLQKTISISQLPEGLYFLSIDNEKLKFTRKILKQH
jgi:hypothetical protein